MFRSFLVICISLCALSLHAQQFRGENIIFSAGPSPFDSTVKFSYYLPEADTISLSVYDRWGHIKQLIHREFYNKGYYDTTFNLTALAAGKYMVVLGAGNAVPIANAVGGKLKGELSQSIYILKK